MAAPASLLQSSARRAAPSRPKQNDSLLKTLGRGTLSGLSAAGNFLDLALGGSSVRDVLAGENPFDQFLTPFSDENRVGGRELLERYGVLGKNREGLDSGDVAGFVAEVALDPGSWVTGAGTLKALGKGGTVLSKSSKLPKSLSRVQRMTTKVGDLAKQIPAADLERAATRSGFASGADFLSRHGSESVGGLLGLGVPFRSPSKVLGTGATAQKIGGALDKVGKAVRYSTPGRVGAALFSRQNRGALTEAGQKLAQTATAGERAAGVAARESFAPHLRAFEEYAQTLPDAAARLDAHDAFRAAVEDTAPLRQDMAHLQPSVDEVRRINADQLALEQAEGLNSTALDDLFADYNRRQRFFFPGDKSKSDFPSLLLSGKHGSQNQRTDILRDIQGGTSLINRLSVDPALSGVVHGKKPSQLTKQFWDQQEQIVNAAMSASGNPNWTYEHSRKLAKWLADLDPRHVSENVPVFPHNPIEEATRRAEIGGRAVEMAKAIRESVKASGSDFMQAPPGSVPVKDVLDRAGLNVPESLNLLGMPADTHIPKELAEDIGRVIKSFRQPDEVGVVLKAVDKFTSLFKTGVTALAPAFHVRNRTSGAIQNWMIGAFSLRSANDADKLIRGRGAISGLQELGGAYKGLTDEQATRKFADEVFAQHVAPRGQGIGLDSLTGTTLDRNMAADIPGVIPNRLRDIGKTAVPRNLRQANPLNVAGVASETDVFAPAAAGRQMGALVESQNRIEGYLELRRQGFAPEQAAGRIRDAHVDYANLSDAERHARRWVPFYSFTKGMSEFVADELLQRPGGKLGQTIRASNNPSDEPLPDYVGQTAAIPLGTLDDGSQRFLTGFGMAQEDPLSLVGIRGGMPDVSGTLAELGSRLNPLLKYPIEAATGESLFQRGPLGGRDIVDQDPPIGRLISNVGELTGLGKRELPSGRAKPFLSQGVEQLAANLPTSRLMTTLRALTDKRKLSGGPFPGSMAALNTLTGARISDVSPASQDALLRDELQATMREAGGSAFESVRFSKAQIAVAEKESPELAQRMRDLNAAAAELAARAKARKKIKRPG